MDQESRAQGDLDTTKGQHFMIDEELLKRTVEASYIVGEDVVLEVGSGSGNLTKHIITKAPQKIICVEQDTRFAVDDPLVEMMHASVLDVIDSISPTVVVANIPYHISEPLLIALLKKHIERMVLVTGKKFADVLTSPTILGTVLTYFYTVEVLEYIPPSAFEPQPKVDSALIRLRSKNQKEQDLFVENFYSYQTSKVKNMIVSILEGSMTKKESKEVLEGLDAELAQKPLYTLSTEEFLAVHQYFKDNFINQA